MSAVIKTAIVPVAGLGTRVMPLTLHQPKGMIGIVDRPVIHYIIDELLAVGITHIILVISHNQEAFEKYITYEQERNPLWKNFTVDYTLQSVMRGNGDALLVARPFLKSSDRYFFVCFGDDLNFPSPLPDMLEVYKKDKTPVLLLERVKKELVSRYGVVDATVKRDRVYDITGIVEKPKIEDAPSDLTIVGRYILNTDILDAVATLEPETPKNKEVYLTDGMKRYLAEGNAISGIMMQGHRFDCGSKAGILKAQMFFALKHPELQEEIKDYLKTLE